MRLVSLILLIFQVIERSGGFHSKNALKWKGLNHSRNSHYSTPKGFAVQENIVSSDPNQAETVQKLFLVVTFNWIKGLLNGEAFCLEVKLLMHFIIQGPLRCCVQNRDPELSRVFMFNPNFFLSVLAIFRYAGRE